MTNTDYLPLMRYAGPNEDGLDRPFWESAADGVLAIQRCNSCTRYQWAPEWICHRCHSFDVGFHPVEPYGFLYAWERVWHPVLPELRSRCPYLVAMVELPHADQVRMIGNLLMDSAADPEIGMRLDAAFVTSEDGPTVVQWRLG